MKPNTPDFFFKKILSSFQHSLFTCLSTLLLKESSFFASVHLHKDRQSIFFTKKREKIKNCLPFLSSSSFASFFSLSSSDIILLQFVVKKEEKYMCENNKNVLSNFYFYIQTASVIDAR